MQFSRKSGTSSNATSSEDEVSNQAHPEGDVSSRNSRMSHQANNFAKQNRYVFAKLFFAKIDATLACFDRMNSSWKQIHIGMSPENKFLAKIDATSTDFHGNSFVRNDYHVTALLATA